MFIKEAKLSGQYVTLEPLSEAHIAPLQAAVQDGEAPTLWYANVPHPNQYRVQAVDAEQSIRCLRCHRRRVQNPRRQPDLTPSHS